MGRGSARSIRSALLALLATLALGACQNGYPIAPTACDEWCHDTIGRDCQTENPAECVAACEYSGISAPECRSEYETALACWRTATSNVCFGETAPCGNEQQALSQCGAAARLNLGLPSQQ